MGIVLLNNLNKNNRTISNHKGSKYKKKLIYFRSKNMKV